MSTDQPFDSFGRLLSEGFEIPLSISIAQGHPSSRIDALFARFAPGVDPGTRQRLTDFAREMEQAGEGMTMLGREDAINLGEIPVNPYLRESRGGGTRLFVSTDFSIDEGGHWYRIDIDLPDASSMLDIYDAISLEAERRVKKSPGAFNNIAIDEDTEIQVRVTIAERGF